MRSQGCRLLPPPPALPRASAIPTPVPGTRGRESEVDGWPGRRRPWAWGGWHRPQVSGQPHSRGRLTSVQLLQPGRRKACPCLPRPVLTADPAAPHGTDRQPLGFGICWARGLSFLLSAPCLCGCSLVTSAGQTSPAAGLFLGAQGGRNIPRALTATQAGVRQGPRAHMSSCPPGQKQPSSSESPKATVRVGAAELEARVPRGLSSCLWPRELARGQVGAPLCRRKWPPVQHPLLVLEMRVL